VPEWLMALVLKCLEKLPENRYQNGMDLCEAIMQNSIGDIKSLNPVNNIVPAQEVGEVEAATVTALPPHDGNMIQISKPVFTILMLLLVGFMAFSGYSLFHNSSPPANVTAKPLTDSLKNPDSSASNNPYSGTSYLQRKRAADSLRDNIIKEEIEKDRKKHEADSLRADTTSN